MSHCIDLTGQVFGRLTVIRRAGNDSDNRAMWSCICECGATTFVRGKDLRSGKQYSCGCLKNEKARDRMIKHGESNSRLYKIWLGMKKRCENTECKSYNDYGKRGIKVCDEWHSYETFKAWALLNGYDDTKTIDRKNVNDGYTPDNCRWVARSVQNNNTRKNHYVEIKGENRTLTEWARIYQISLSTVYQRIKRGWDEISAVILPPDSSKQRIKDDIRQTEGVRFR